ncbi:uncharacterized protein LOC107647212 [Arachis ipaensis]|uniref:uncharacterized protein LOC107647212 n=1 Tax=Arachis ipaensis TaxID=130454 RepID=UPI000A2AF17E|nr:uncharacterized protein LOC107647212 [Arachis ipaensis]
MTDDELKNFCLIEIEKILNSNARSLRDYQSIPYLEMSDVCLFQNKLIEEELAYDTNDLTHTNLYTEQKMTHEQRLVFDEILNAVITDSGGFTSFMGMVGVVLKLHTNMRLLMSSSDQDEGEMKRFANWILDVGNGNIGSIVGDESKIEIPDDLLIATTDDPLFHLVDFAYPNLLQNMSDYRYFQSRTIHAPTLESGEKVNDGMEKEYLSFDTTCQADENEDVQQEWFTLEFLNDIKCSGLPNHKLTLKPGVAVMLLRNIY